MGLGNRDNSGNNRSNSHGNERHDEDKYDNVIDDEVEEEERVVEVLQPYTEDLIEEKQFCVTCELVVGCPILKGVNLLEKQRCVQRNIPTKTVEEEWGCTLHRI